MDVSDLPLMSSFASCTCLEQEMWQRELQRQHHQQNDQHQQQQFFQMPSPFHGRRDHHGLWTPDHLSERHIPFSHVQEHHERQQRMQVLHSSHVQEMSVKLASASAAPHNLDLQQPQYLHRQQQPPWATSAGGAGGAVSRSSLPEAGGAGYSCSLPLPLQELPDAMQHSDVLEELQEEDWAEEEGWTDTHIHPGGHASQGGGGRGSRAGGGRIRRHGKGSGRGGKHKRAAKA
jgi:hypothetical protein